MTVAFESQFETRRAECLSVSKEVFSSSSVEFFDDGLNRLKDRLR